jgi:hypothetical protein
MVIFSNGIILTLQDRLDLKNLNMIESKDYKKLRQRLPTLLSPEDVKKVIKLKGVVKNGMAN